MSSPPVPSISAAIEQLRAEIIAPDWQLSPQRIIRLRAALVSLAAFFTNRSHGLALLKMALSVVDHIDQQGNEANAVDFLKEDMAHIVSLYEDDEQDPDREKETASRAYKRFRRLNISVTSGGLEATPPGQNAAALLATLEALSKEAAQLPSLLDQAGSLATEDRKKAAALLGKISAAINITWAHLPPADK